MLAEHALALEALPALQKDPFDRLLVAQAIVEGFILLTADERLARYPGPCARFDVAIALGCERREYSSRRALQKRL